MWNLPQTRINQVSCTWFCHQIAEPEPFQPYKFISYQPGQIYAVTSPYTATKNRSLAMCARNVSNKNVIWNTIRKSTILRACRLNRTLIQTKNCLSSSTSKKMNRMAVSSWTKSRRLWHNGNRMAKNPMASKIDRQSCSNATNAQRCSRKNAISIDINAPTRPSIRAIFARKDSKLNKIYTNIWNYTNWKTTLMNSERKSVWKSKRESGKTTAKPALWQI